MLALMIEYYKENEPDENRKIILSLNKNIQDLTEIRNEIVHAYWLVG